MSDGDDSRRSTPSGDANDDLTVLRAPTGGSAGEAFAPRVLKQRFVLESKLGSGGMGTVYRARDLRKVEARDRNPYLAVKVLNNDFRAHPDAFIALQREASKSQALAHPNIVSIYDFDKDGDIPFMTMELLEGQELSELLHEYPNGLPDAIAWQIVEGIAAGLRRAHNAGITHADFKPGNVFVTKTGRPKILDFGIARAAHINQLDDDLTVFDPSRFAALTPAYASAEMLQGEEPVPADDIFSFGVVTYLLFTGQHPYGRVRADEAAEKGMRPQRIKRLSRRQWRILESMLAFERAERPPGMDEVIGGLLPVKPVTYWATGTVAALLLVALAGAWMGLNGNASRDVVTRDVLTSVQIRRIEELIAVPAFTPEWEGRLLEETERLAGVEGAEQELADIRQRVLALYQEQIERTAAFDEALALVRGADRMASDGRFDPGHVLLLQRLGVELDALLTQPMLDRDWVDALEAGLSHLHEAFPDAPVIAEYEQAAGTAYLMAISRQIDEEKAALAGSLLEMASPRVFDAELVEGAAERLTALKRSVRQREANLQRRADERQLRAGLAELDAISCQRMEATPVKAAHDTLVARYPWARPTILSAATGALAACIAELAEVDQDRAQALQQAARREFGTVAALETIQFDPCAMRYLVGAGSRAGRSGFCVDQLDDGHNGPRLVVVPGPAGRFAIGRAETAWRDLAPFCAEQGGCSVPTDPTAPVTGVGRDVAEAFAQWLSRRSGFVYRLPTWAEWQAAAAAGPPDPNRNCQVQLSGVVRGGGPVAAGAGEPNEYGLVNALGNVQEWVLDGDRLRAAGGAYTDAMARCTSELVRDHSGEADAITGFRLVREIP